MNNKLRQEILNELNVLLSEQIDTGDLAKNTGRTGKAAGIVAVSVASNGILAIPAVASFFSRSPLELKRAINIASKDPKGLADFIKAQMSSNYIDDTESETMVGLANAYKIYCKNNNDNNWCKKAVAELGDYKTLINSKWKATEIGGQKEDKMNLIDILEEFEAMKPSSPSSTPSPTPTPAPKPEEGQVGVQGKNSFKCPNQEDVAVFQQWLGVKEDCSVGVNTIKAAQSKGMKLTLQDYFSAESLTPEQKKNQIQFCNSLKTNRPGYETAIKNAGQTVRGKCPATSGGGSGKKSNIPKAGSIACQGEFVSLIKGRYMGLKKNKDDSGVDIIIDNNIDQSLKTAVDYLASTLNVPQKTVKNCKEAEQFYKYVRPAKPLQENYYDNKKLNEAKQLFNKLLKNI